ncbi:MAG: DUF922 domain-containing protein [Alphaproteobacteria bacterium]|nr:DUF922 domain-containing protein [Alphaproteobacteria bacterium]
MRTVSVILAGLMAVCIWADSAAGQTSLSVEITTGQDHWEISGRTEDELIDFVNANLMLRTDYNFDVHASPFYDQRVGEGCWIAGGSMTAHTIVSAPEWVDYERANRSLRRRWDAYAEQVALHSQGHIEISRQGAQIIAQRLAAIPPQQSCSELRTLVDSTLDSLIDALQVSHRNYDRDSGGMPRISRPLPIRR